METEFLLIIMLALFVLIACAVTISAWALESEAHGIIGFMAFQYAFVLALTLACLGVFWSNGITPLLGQEYVSAEAALLFLMLVLSVMYINQMEGLHGQHINLT